MTSNPHTAVCIGRFQPLHEGHMALLRQGLAVAGQLVVVLGSAWQARTPKNPFTWQERADMVRAALSPDEQARVRFLPVRDYYNMARWVQVVRRGVDALAAEHAAGAPASVTLVGHFKDDSSRYLARFPGWQLCPLDRASPVDAVQLRDALLGSSAEALPGALDAVAAVVAPATAAFLRQWVAGAQFAALCAEWQMLRRYRQAWAAAPYPPVFVTVDAVVRCAGQVLLIRRGQAPGKGLYAVPGGFIEQRETTLQSALRELQEETCLDLPAERLHAALQRSAVFDHPDRSQRGRTITHAFFFDLDAAGCTAPPAIQAADDAQSAEWVPQAQLLALEDQFHDDHFHMLDVLLGLLPADPA